MWLLRIWFIYKMCILEVECNIVVDKYLSEFIKSDASITTGIKDFNDSRHILLIHFHVERLESRLQIHTLKIPIAKDVHGQKQFINVVFNQLMERSWKIIRISFSLFCIN